MTPKLTSPFVRPRVASFKIDKTAGLTLDFRLVQARFLFNEGKIFPNPGISRYFRLFRLLRNNGVSVPRIEKGAPAHCPAVARIGPLGARRQTPWPQVGWSLRPAAIAGWDSLPRGAHQGRRNCLTSADRLGSADATKPAAVRPTTWVAPPRRQVLRATEVIPPRPTASRPASRAFARRSRAPRTPPRGAATTS